MAIRSPHLRMEDHTFDDLSDKFVDEDDIGVNVPRGRTTCVKEVNWSEFTSDSNPRDGGGNGSYSDFFTQLDDSTAVVTRGSNSIDYRALNKVVDGDHTTSLEYYSTTRSSTYNDNHDHYYLTSSINYNGGQYWENIYPGWSYDPNTGLWHQQISYNNNNNNNNKDLAHMVFDPQYPGWFYDTITQEWKSLEYYNAVMNGQTNFHHQQQNHHNNIVQDHDLGWNIDDDQQAWKTASLPQTGHHFIHTMELDLQNSFIPANGFSNHFENCCKNDSRKEMQLSNGNFQLQPEFNQGMISHFPCISNEEKMSIGHLPHALATFGFGGKLIVMKNNSSPNSIYGGQVDSAGGVIKILNLMDIFRDKNDLSFPGPLVGGNVGSKEVHRWIDEKISSYSQIPYMGNRKGSFLSLLFSLLKIACHYYGKLRSPLGTDLTLKKENDCAESAVAKLFASSSKRNGYYANSGLYLQNVPSEGERQAVAHEVQKCLVYGRMREALQLAQGGQLWGPALVIAAQLGNQSYNDTVKQMALQQLVAGSPLRTLWLLIAGQPADIFYGTAHTSIVHDSVEISHHPSEIGAICMLDAWEENLAIIAANRTKDDELVITHLGDCLWKERGEVTAAHICYLVAEANFESYSDSARLCLVGADHWKFPRTFASLEAIQMTEIFEYSKVLGNPQFILTPFQPYKIIYAYMLAEMGKIGDSLKYCQAISKCLRTTRVPEAESWKSLLLALEHRIKIYQQGGYSVNSGPVVNLVGKLLNLFDTTAQRVVGLSPPVPHSPQSGAKHVKQDHPPCKGGEGNGVSCSQSAMAMSSLVPSASVEQVCDWRGNTLKPRHNRSISEPDFGKSPRKDVQVGFTHRTPRKEEKSSALSVGFARFGRFGSQIFQKTVGMMLRSRSTDRQAKLGDKNKFHYDKKLKRWVEEGTDVQVKETTLPPPPKIAAFPDKTSQQQKSRDSPEKKIYNQTETTNSYNLSGGGHMGIRSRYVDTFNKKGNVSSSNKFQFHAPAAKRNGIVGVPYKFFVPGQVMAQSQQAISSALMLSPSSMQRRLLSFDDIASKKGDGMLSNQNCWSSSSPHSRRTVSWSGCFPDLSEDDGCGVIYPVPTISQEQHALENK